MKGIFEAGDFLIIEPCDFKKLRKGDIVSYKDEKNNVLIVHRIIRIVGEQLFTRGDNNRRTDILPVSTSHLVGKVTAVERGGKTLRVRGGVVGLARARTGYLLRRGLSRIAGGTRRFLPVRRIGNLVFFFWKPRIRKVVFSTAEGPVIKWVHGSRAIARWLPQRNLLKTSFLSRLLIRANKLS